MSGAAPVRRARLLVRCYCPSRAFPPLTSAGRRPPRRPALLLLALLLASPAAAHDWYPWECCAGRDCYEAPAGAVKPEPGGWRVVNTGELIPYARARTSPDDHVHLCQPTVNGVRTTRCLYVPFQGG